MPARSTRAQCPRSRRYARRLDPALSDPPAGTLAVGSDSSIQDPGAGGVVLRGDTPGAPLSVPPRTHSELVIFTIEYPSGTVMPCLL
ncbi:hypothetical protein ACFP51_35510 [Streptomyces pratens]|uniref:Uncharacterized protein n=1 Tax=Streptomyces pratens TaxID=887456 RepID=A0ABW1LUB5_9ACTN